MSTVRMLELSEMRRKDVQWAIGSLLVVSGIIPFLSIIIMRVQSLFLFLILLSLISAGLCLLVELSLEAK